MFDEAVGGRHRGLAESSIAAHGGRYLVRGAEPDAVEGDWRSDARLVVVEFPAVEAARAWYGSADYAEALRLRDAALNRRLVLVEGLPVD